MPIEKGHTNNPNGRPKGKPNRVTMNAREFINAFIKKNRKRLQRDWDLLEPYQRVQMLEKLYSFTTPKMSSFEVDRLTEMQMDDILNKLIQQNEQHKKQLQPSKN